MTAPSRVVAVLGFSVRGGGGLHPVCAARVETAAGLAREDDVVVLSGWARTPGARSEAELMRGAWTGSAARLVLDDGATHTAQNRNRHLSRERPSMFQLHLHVRRAAQT